MSTTRYHVNPQNKVLRCSAASEESCKFQGAAHFQGSKEQAQFMQETLDAALQKTPRATPPAQTHDPNYFSMPFRGDHLVAQRNQFGRYSIRLRETNQTIQDNVHLEGGSDAAGLKRWAVNELPYQAKKIEVDPAQHPGISHINAVFTTDDDGALVHQGFIVKGEGKSGWTPILRLDELKSKPYLTQRGYISAMQDTIGQSEAFHARGAAQLKDLRAQAWYNDLRGELLSESQVKYVMAGEPIVPGETLWEVDPDAAREIRAQFIAEGWVNKTEVTPNAGDRVYLREVPDPRDPQRIHHITAIWGSRKHYSLDHTFFTGERISAEQGLLNWLGANYAGD